MMRSIIYARVSTTDKGQDPERQRREMQEFAKARGWATIEIIDMMSASKDRPGLRELWRLCRRRQVDVVLVHEFSRFARTLKELVLALEEFNSLGIQFISLQEQVDTTTPAGKFMYQMIAAFAEFERAMIRDRVRSGLAHARAKGKRLGRPLAVIDGLDVAAMRELGATWDDIARDLGASKDTCKRAFRRSQASLVDRLFEGVSK
jgi:DNA invertase Pin-like site-specific DNA recombinase